MAISLIVASLRAGPSCSFGSPLISIILQAYSLPVSFSTHLLTVELTPLKTCNKNEIINEIVHALMKEGNINEARKMRIYLPKISLGSYLA